MAPPRCERLTRAAAALLLIGTLLLNGCAGMGDFAPEAAGLGAGAGAGVLTANPLVGVAVAMVTRLATAETLGYVEGEQQTRVQKAIAAAGGAARSDEVLDWRTEPSQFFDTIYGTINGQLQVVRDFGGVIACRELLYTVAEPSGGLEGAAHSVEQDVDGLTAAPTPSPATPAGRAWPQAATGEVLAAVICNAGRGWRWAVSRPATEAVW